MRFSINLESRRSQSPFMQSHTILARRQNGPWNNGSFLSITQCIRKLYEEEEYSTQHNNNNHTLGPIA